MALTINDLLSPQVILDVVSRMRVGQGRLGKWFGWHYDKFEPDRGGLMGPNVRESPTRSGSYRFFDQTRTVAQFSVPGTAPAWTPPQAVGEAFYTCARVHEKQKILGEELAFMSKVIGPSSVVDANGQDYITRQEKYLAQRMNNAIEFMAAGLVRGGFYLAFNGSTFYPSLNQPASGAYSFVDFKVPASNKGQLNALGAGNIIGTTWLSPSAPIIGNDLPKILDAYTKLTGLQLRDIWCNQSVWPYVITNTSVVNAAGSAMTPFTELAYTDAKGGTDAGMTAILRGYPMLTWHITSEVLIDNGGTDLTYAAGTGTRVPVIPDNTIFCAPPVDDDWQSLITFGEPVSDSPGMPMVKRPGFYMWHEWVTQSSAIEILGLMNLIPELKIPLAIMNPTVIF